VQGGRNPSVGGVGISHSSAGSCHYHLQGGSGCVLLDRCNISSGKHFPGETGDVDALNKIVHKV
jgi:hypothetical protein